MSPDEIIALLGKHYDSTHGVTSSRPVVDACIKESTQPFRDVSDAFRQAPQQWQLPLVDAMRALAATGYCTADDAPFMFDATSTVAAEAGSDEYLKTINAMASAEPSAGAVVRYVLRLLQEPNEFRRRLAFYAVALLLEKGTARIPQDLQARLKAEVRRDPSEERQAQFREVTNRL